MKIIVLILFVLIQNYEKVESVSLLNILISVISDVANLIKTKLETARQGFKSFVKKVFRENSAPLEVNTVTLSEQPHDTQYRRNKVVIFDNVRNVYLPVDRLVQSHGRRLKTYKLNTTDGYEIVLHRLIYPVGLRGISQTVLLHHGLLGSSADWFLLGPEKSLPYYLATLGYDVWLANARGNRYSRGHTKLLTNTTEYWNFSFQEIGLYDLPAVIDYIRNVTKEPINFIGHSMGATALLVLLSSKPQYNDYLRMAILLGPLVFMRTIKGPLRMLSLISDTPPEELFGIFGKDEYVPSRTLPEVFLKRFCLDEELFCSNPLFFVSGVPRNHTSWDKHFMKLVFQHVPAGGSTKTFLHYSQLVKNAKFHEFGNASKEFPLREVTTPVALISSSDDWLAQIPDLVRLYINIFNPIEHYIIRNRNVSHTDFVWGPNANILVFPKVIDLLQSTSKLIGKQNEV